MQAAGEIFTVMRDDALPFADALLPVIIRAMHDANSRRVQELAVRALGQVCIHTCAIGHISIYMSLIILQ